MNKQSTSQNLNENIVCGDKAEQTPRTPVREKKKRGKPKGTPPRKAPNFITPPKKSLLRKRKATPEIWKNKCQKETSIHRKGIHICEGKCCSGKMFEAC